MSSLPDGWRFKTLRDLALINYGKSPSAILSEDGPYPVVGTGGTERTGNDYLYDGDSIILGRKGTIDRVYFVTGRFWTIDTAYYLSGFRNALPRWLFYFLQTLDLRQLNEATGVPSLSRELLYTLEIPTPPEPEQETIAELIATVDLAIEYTERLVGKQKRISAGLLHDLLTYGVDRDGAIRSRATHDFKDSKLGPVPAQWRCESLSYFVPTAEYGISTALGDVGHPVLRMNNLSNGEISLSDLKYTAHPVPQHLWLRPRDVLFNRTNSWEHVGRTALWRGESGMVTFASYLVRLNTDTTRLLPELLNLWLNWPVTQISMRRFATPGVQQVNINPTNLRMLDAAFPSSLDEQAAIVHRVDEVRTALQNTRIALAKLHSLKRGLMRDLLTGRTRVASKLDDRAASSGGVFNAA